MSFLVCKECVVCSGHHAVHQLGCYDDFQKAQAVATRLNRRMKALLLEDRSYPYYKVGQVEGKEIRIPVQGC